MHDNYDGKSSGLHQIVLLSIACTGSAQTATQKQRTSRFLTATDRRKQAGGKPSASSDSSSFIIWLCTTPTT